MQRSVLRALGMVLFETALILLLVAVAAWLRLGENAWRLFALENGLAKAFLVTFVTQVCLYFSDLYAARQTTDRRETIFAVPPPVWKGMPFGNSPDLMITARRPSGRPRSRLDRTSTRPGREAGSREAARAGVQKTTVYRFLSSPQAFRTSFRACS